MVCRSKTQVFFFLIHFSLFHLAWTSCVIRRLSNFKPKSLYKYSPSGCNAFRLCIPQNTTFSFFNSERHLEKYVVYFFHVLDNMDTYIMNKILYCDDYFVINKISLKPILSKLLIFRMWITTMIHPVYTDKYVQVLFSNWTELDCVYNFHLMFFLNQTEFLLVCKQKL